MVSVLQDWVMELSLREQGTLLTAVRGCDLAPKYSPEGLVIDTPERRLARFIRWAFMVPADDREVDIPGAFMATTAGKIKPSAFGHYPHHWVTHIMHALEVIAYRCPHPRVAEEAYELYYAFVHSMHLVPEIRPIFLDRMNEDRVANGTVVS